MIVEYLYLVTNRRRHNTILRAHLWAAYGQRCWKYWKHITCRIHIIYAEQSNWFENVISFGVFRCHLKYIFSVRKLNVQITTWLSLQWMGIQCKAFQLWISSSGISEEWNSPNNTWQHHGRMVIFTQQESSTFEWLMGKPNITDILYGACRIQIWIDSRVRKI